MSTPHPPQLAGALPVSTHLHAQAGATQLPPHIVVPPWHESAHIPAEQTAPGQHWIPQPSQLAGSVCVSTH
ncbi:MAG: hypothetical protein HY744_17385 [Deltaproteobacteria bacterium]|nr:hypothetical protein [Deltaproteobacteria bacterium]